MASRANGGGKKTRAYTEDHARAGIDAQLPEIECWENQFPGYEIEISTSEFTSVCPRTGLPDHGTLTITYVPGKLCLELKSLKMYLLEYRNLGIFQENIVNRVLNDIVRAAQPVSATVLGNFAQRGGLSSKMTAQYPSASGKSKGSRRRG